MWCTPAWAFGIPNSQNERFTVAKRSSLIAFIECASIGGPFFLSLSWDSFLSAFSQSAKATVSSGDQLPNCIRSQRWLRARRLATPEPLERPLELLRIDSTEVTWSQKLNLMPHLFIWFAWLCVRASLAIPRPHGHLLSFFFFLMIMINWWMQQIYAAHFGTRSAHSGRHTPHRVRAKLRKWR